jgi:hypothetical protein
LSVIYATLTQNNNQTWESSMQQYLKIIFGLEGHLAIIISK